MIICFYLQRHPAKNLKWFPCRSTTHILIVVDEINTITTKKRLVKFQKQSLAFLVNLIFSFSATLTLMEDMEKIIPRVPNRDCDVEKILHSYLYDGIYRSTTPWQGFLFRINGIKPTQIHCFVSSQESGKFERFGSYSSETRSKIGKLLMQKSCGFSSDELVVDLLQCVECINENI